MTIGNNANRPASTIGSLGTFLTSDQQEELFVQGKAFSFEDYFTFGAGEVKDIVLDPTAFAGVQIVVNPVIAYATVGPITMDFHGAVLADDDGTLLGASNRREGMPGPATLLRLGATITDAGVKFAGDMIPATGVAPGNASGGGNAQSLPFEILAASKKMLRLTNTDGAGAIVEIKITWFEI